ncbi:MAG: LamG-like jellyroll fold domain-containing protein [Bacteroidota bacterium]
MKNLIILLVLACGINVYGQVAINIDGSAPDNSAMLDVKATDRGLLIPRISNDARNIIPSPATGLLLYNATTNQLNFYNGIYWHELDAEFITSTIGTLSVEGGISINTSSAATAENSAMLDVNNPTRGILIPRTSPDLITAPATGLIIFNTDINMLNYYNGTQWRTLCSVSTGIQGAGGSQNSVGMAVNTDNSSPHHSAMLDVSASNKGVLIPALTNEQRNAIIPATGLVIYNTSVNSIEYFNGLAWYQILSNVLDSPIAGNHDPSFNQITWHWSVVNNATGYKWNHINDYYSATDMGMNTIKTETGLACNTNYTRYVWAYNTCSVSNATELVQTTILPILEITPSNRNVTYVSGNTSFDIASNSSWTAVSDQFWCTITNPSGSGNAALNLSYEQNTSPNHRTATITIIGNGCVTRMAALTQQVAIPTQGLVAYYPFNGNANDESGNGNNGVVHEAALTTNRANIENAAYSFNGINNYIVVEDNSNLDLTSQLSISGWMYKYVNVPWASMVTKGGTYNNVDNNYTVHNNPSNGIVFTNDETSGACVDNSSFEVPVNEWHHITVTFDESVVKMYLDGVLDTLSILPCNLQLQVNTSQLFIGLDIPGASEYFNGKLDDIRIYNRGLTADEIIQLYQE